MSNFDNFLNKEADSFLLKKISQLDIGESTMFDGLKDILKSFGGVVKNIIFRELSKIDFTNPEDVMKFRKKWGDLK